MLAQQSSQLAHELCSGRCMWVLEGGYHLPSLAASVVGSFLGALGEPGLQADAPAAPPGGAWLREEPLHKVADVIQRVQALHGLLQE
jgi:acetoin utilization deacetylase AcuC-like enzyme